ncbi:hypothetical protein [Natronorubrum sulfidifaciens]|uniref:Uncharacterized protein n=1 Tax=Natronorubrum sulfidifaciens JCM 14089 TaxID=1230460 RepID=L9W8A4_9EURY|nr:hypothetical protein [Natronorubrum sulfidifaciens]ELY44528.1 hypothetical protein C495_11524 [Natronorubrum sulfidifaciens JCM 14089]
MARPSLEPEPTASTVLVTIVVVLLTFAVLGAVLLPAVGSDRPNSADDSERGLPAGDSSDDPASTAENPTDESDSDANTGDETSLEIDDDPSDNEGEPNGGVVDGGDSDPPFDGEPSSGPEDGPVDDFESFPEAFDGTDDVNAGDDDDGPPGTAGPPEDAGPPEGTGAPDDVGPP